jgi:hypothetical protein
LGKKWVWLHFRRFFSQTHLVTLLADLPVEKLRVWRIWRVALLQTREHWNLFMLQKTVILFVFAISIVTAARKALVKKTFFVIKFNKKTFFVVSKMNFCVDRKK